jgi:LCP family protein required for cell wall assembly
LTPISRWPRRLLVTANVVVALCLVSTGMVYGYVRYRVAQLKTIKLPGLTPGGEGVGGAALNILLVGSNTRTGLDPAEAAQFGSASDVPGARSDVTMILHLDPTTGAASLLSIPRDLFVPMPPHSAAGPVAKIDGALNDGPNNLITAITNDLGIPINHYIEINFDGFRRTIDAIGGISMNFPTPLRDSFSTLQVTKTGCQQLNGTTALAVVRARHLQYYANGHWNDDPQSDLARIRRDHTFLRIFVNAAKAQTSNPLRVNALVGALLNQVTVDSTLDVNTLLGLLRRFRHIDADRVAQTTLPITVVGNYHFGGSAYGDVDMPVEPIDHQVIDTWSGQAATPISPSSISVSLVNISGGATKSANANAALGALGFQTAGTTVAPTPAPVTETVVHYHPGSAAQGLAVLHSLSGAVMLQSDPTVADGSVTLYLGSVVAFTAAQSVATSVPTTAATPSTRPASSTTSVATNASAAPSTTTPVLTAGGAAPSSAVDLPTSFDPIAC